MNDQERDQLGQIVRKALQHVGISSLEPWRDISEERRERHRKAAEEIWVEMNEWFQKAIGTWADKVFPTSTLLSMLNHLDDEACELREAIAIDSEINEEIVDSFLILLHLAHRRGLMLIPDSLEKHHVIEIGWNGTASDVNTEQS